MVFQISSNDPAAASLVRPNFVVRNEKARTSAKVLALDR
jgi:hypothetical protein